MSTSAKSHKCPPGCTCGRHRRKMQDNPTVYRVYPPGEAPTEAEPVAALPSAAPPVVTVARPAVSVLVPWRDNGAADRRDAWKHVRGLWEAAHPDWQIVEGDAPGRAWRKGLAVLDALSRADADVLVIADADVWCDGIGEAVNAVVSGRARWAMPHHRVLRLTSVASAEVYRSGRWPRHRTVTTYAQRPYPGHPGGGMVVMTRAAYAAAPIDTRFAGWGQEDDSWAIALRSLVGPGWRGTADLWHLWHAPQARQSRAIGSAANLALFRQYQRAAKDRKRMTALVEAGRP